MATSTRCAHHAAGFLAGGAGLESKELKNGTEKATRDLIPAVPCILELFGFFSAPRAPSPSGEGLGARGSSPCPSRIQG